MVELRHLKTRKRDATQSENGKVWGVFFRYLIKHQNDRHSNDCYVQVKCFYDGCVVGGVALSDPA